MADTITLHHDITNAKQQLDTARRDGAADKISYWAKRLNELVDQLPRKAHA